MLFVFFGTDRKKARAALRAALSKHERGGRAVLRLTDANAEEDVAAALLGPGLFGEARAIVLENVCTRAELADLVLPALADMSASAEPFFLYEEKPLAAVRKTLEKHAASVEVHDEKKRSGEKSAVFALANALKKRDRKALWAGYQRALQNGDAPEAILGILFWGAKDLFLKARADSAELLHAKRHLAALAALPHEARRRGVELEYALERYVLEV